MNNPSETFEKIVASSVVVLTLAGAAIGIGILLSAFCPKEDHTAPPPRELQNVRVGTYDGCEYICVLTEWTHKGNCKNHER